MCYNLNMNNVIKIIFLITLFVFPISVFAMGSANYKINADAIGTGGSLGASTNYQLSDTLGEPVTGIGSSTNFVAEQGFQYMVSTGISLTIDSNTQNLGTVTPGASATGQSTLTVTTDSWGGYDLLASENHGLLHTDAVTTIPDYASAISAPSTWSGNGFGLTVLSGTGVEGKWGSNPNYAYAAVPTSATVFHTKTGYTSGGDQTVVGYYVAPSSSQKSGTYSNIITYTALAQL